MSAAPATTERCDLAVIGAGLAGTATALLVRRAVRGARCVVLDEHDAPRAGGTLTARGEAARFLARDLDLTSELVREELPHHGVRHFWAPGEDASLGEMVETGEGEVPRVPAFHVDHHALLQTLEGRAVLEGVDVRRGVRIEEQESLPPRRVIVYRQGGEEHRLAARWVVAASRPELFARRQGVEDPLDLHLAEARWSGLRRWEEVLPRDAARTWRPLAEHHFVGRGWRVRLTPLSSGEHALAAALERGEAPELAERFANLADLQSYGAFIRSRPGLRELLRGAAVAPESFLAHDLSPGLARPSCGPGWLLVGNAAGQLDPFDDAPLRQILETVRGAVGIITRDLGSPRPTAELDLVERDEAFHQEFLRRARRQGAGCYVLHGDAEVDAAALFSDRFFDELPPHAHLDALRGWLRARLVRLARRRLSCGLYGAPPPSLALAGGGAAGALRATLRSWGRLELEDLRARLSPVEDDDHRPPSADIQGWVASRAAR